jgi:dihydrofolate synthase/folylpolyglutamate synthase
MAEAILRAHGLRTGLYTSPHLVDMLERIRIDARPVERGEFVQALNVLRPHLERLRPTYFEIMTAAAFVSFARRRVGCAIVEVGLGGRLDATNVLTPVACAILPVGYDHMDKLGTTLASIAGEKAGIIKRGVPVVVGLQRPAARRVIAARARAMGAPVTVPRKPWPRVAAAGTHQRENAAVAVALARHVAPLRPDLVARALSTVHVPGRLETVAPGWIVDVAHNPLAMRATEASLPKAKRRIVIFGASRDKDWRAMLRILRADALILTRADHPRACPPAEMARVARGVTVGSVARAVRLARKMKRRGDLVLVTGSFYVAGEAMQALRR